MGHIKLYNDKPKVNEYVNFIFTKYHENYIQCYLIDYNLDAIMALHCLTNKKKIKSLKSLAPLNKPTIGLVENISSNSIELNIISVNVNDNYYDSFIERNNKNIQLKKLINQYSHKFNINIDYILNNYIYNQEDIEYLDNIINSPINNDFYNFVKEKNTIKCDNGNYLELQMVSYNNINNIIKLFNQTIEDLNIQDIFIVQPKPSIYRIIYKGDIELFKNKLKDNLNIYDDINLLSKI